MAKLRTAIDSAFWDLNVSTARTLDGTARSIPGEPMPMNGGRTNQALRVQQLSLIGNGFPLGLVPSFSPPSRKELGSFALQSLFLRAAISNWWVGLVGQVRPKKLISKLKEEINAIREEIGPKIEWVDLELSTFKGLPKCFIDKSFYWLGACSHLSLTDSSSVLLNMEKPGEREGQRLKAMFMHKLSDHDITLETAWPERFIDHKGRYWDVPESISLDCSSHVSSSGLRYRFGIHKNSGQPIAVDNTNDAPHPALMPGVCAKAAFSYEKQKEIWREKEEQKDRFIMRNEQLYFRPAYDFHLKEPHATISGIIGGTCAAWVGGGNNTYLGSSRSSFSADLFASAGYTFQHGKFRNLFNDLTRVDARLDIRSAAALAKQVSKLFTGATSDSAKDGLYSPRLNLILQQQVIGPVVFRIDSRYCISSSGIPLPRLEDYVLSLDYSLRVLHSGKVVAWYSPRRNEAMLELRVFEF
ncbi:unnamed protein product [Cuscuta epithymum]|uniref:Uncharacterized protein n=1 Tax=Cuscuta epithymum TaxID=186058 RepID=A0AAV0DB05_9ASTE|nr:unnamed protein product [Cuscuta epithymum]CAH9147281.1 unnamed protein product [Cuscuta epithymum]